MAKKTYLKSALVILLFVLVVGAPVAAGGQIFYVDDDAPGANDGSSWPDAFNYLQDALAAAWSGDEIRVAEGIYTPDSNSADPNGSGDREATFQLINGVTLKGGYAGFGQPDPNARDIELYETILTGDLAGNDIEVTNPADLLDEPTRAENSYHVVTGSGTDETAVLDGFTITAGNANEGYQSPNRLSFGGGMYNQDGNPTLTNCAFQLNSAKRLGGGMFSSGNPTLTNCTFTRNSSAGGGGGMSNHGNSVLTNCTFTENSASSGGGMVSCQDPILRNCMFIGNSARSGGGIHNYDGSPTLVDCMFKHNTAPWGGGMQNYYCDTPPTIINCTFMENLATEGGGMINIDSSPILLNCTFKRNTAWWDGGGMYNAADDETNNYPTLIGCIFSDNLAGRDGGAVYSTQGSQTLTDCIFRGNSARSGGGIYNYCHNSLDLVNCILSGNTAIYEGGGIHNWCNTDLDLTNCTLAGNSALNGNAIACDSTRWLTLLHCILWDGGEEIWNNDGSIIRINYSDVQGGWPGEGNIDQDPCFANPGYWDPNGTPQDANDDFWIDGDYHLLADSPCIDSGDPNYIAGPNETDLDGKPRVINGRIDMGAYESPIFAEARIVPRSINLASKGKWITSYIWLPEDCNVTDIDPNSVLLEYEIKPEQFSVDEQAQLATARFSREEVQAILEVGDIDLTITGRLTGGTPFEAKDSIRVINKAGKK